MKLSSMAILLVAVGALMIPAMPSAMAMPGPAMTFIPGTAVQGQTITIELLADTNFLDTEIEMLRVSSPGKGDITEVLTQINIPLLTLNLGSSCDNGLYDATNPGNVPVWELQRNNMRVGISFDDAADGVQVTFGGGGTPTVTEIGTVVISPGAGTYDWVQLTPGLGAVADNLDVVGAYLTGTCGGDKMDTGNKGAYADFPSLFVDPPVAGVLLPINTSALLIAGITTSAIWLVPVIGGAVAAGFTLYKLQPKRKLE